MIGHGISVAEIEKSHGTIAEGKESRDRQTNIHITIGIDHFLNNPRQAETSAKEVATIIVNSTNSINLSI